jgi:hypothetical protein
MGTFLEFKEKRYLFKSIIFYLLDVILICFLISSFKCVNLKQTDDMDPLYAKFNQIIVTPPSFEQLQISQNYLFDGSNNLKGLDKINQNQNFMANVQSRGHGVINSYPPSNEEFVFVPTPVDRVYFEKMKQDKNNQMINLQNFPNFLSSDNSADLINNLNSGINKISLSSQPFFEPKFLEKDFNSLNDKMHQSLLKTSEENNNINFKSLDPNQYPDNIQKLINLQKHDYEKYFNTLNNIEYQKIYQSLNQNQINQEMKVGDSLVDYNQVLNMDLKNIIKQNNKTGPFNFNSTNLVIDLPTNKKEIEDLYSKVFSQINKNNSLSFVQLNKNIVLENGKAPMYGKIDTKIRKIIPKIIGVPNKKDLNQKDYEKKIDENKRKQKEREAIENEMDRRSRDNYPRFRSEYPHEKSDKQDMVYIKAQKKREFIKLKKKVEGEGSKKNITFSFIQGLTQDPENKKKLLDAVDIIIQKRDKEMKEKARLNLANCQRNCDNTCERASKFKHESEEMCKTKCYLACNRNTLNNLLK